MLKVVKVKRSKDGKKAHNRVIGKTKKATKKVLKKDSSENPNLLRDKLIDKHNEKWEKTALHRESAHANARKAGNKEYDTFLKKNKLIKSAKAGKLDITKHGAAINKIKAKHQPKISKAAHNIYEARRMKITENYAYTVKNNKLVPPKVDKMGRIIMPKVKYKKRK